MKITQVRNATLLIHYAGIRFLIDPMLAPKGAYPGFEGMANSHLRNPLVELPLPMVTLLEVDAVIVTHDHLDHWESGWARSVGWSSPIPRRRLSTWPAIRSGTNRWPKA